MKYYYLKKWKLKVCTMQHAKQKTKQKNKIKRKKNVSQSVSKQIYLIQKVHTYMTKFTILFKYCLSSFVSVLFVVNQIITIYKIKNIVFKQIQSNDVKKK